MEKFPPLIIQNLDDTTKFAISNQKPGQKIRLAFDEETWLYRIPRADRNDEVTTEIVLTRSHIEEAQPVCDSC